MYQAVGKRILDVIFSTILLLIASPILLLVAILVRVNLGSPIFFRQIRPGKDTEEIELVKFRTMRDILDSEGNPLPDKIRLTRFGAFLRSTSLDELPELWNVVRGDLSLVGPRPLLKEYVPRYSPVQNRRHDVRPGITGWAQVNGRNAISWSKKLELDVWYVDNLSLKLDLKIIVMTIWSVVCRRGISAVGHATAPEFDGSN